MIECRRRFFLAELLSATPFTVRILITETAGHRKPPSKWSGHLTLSGLLTLCHWVRSFPYNANSDSMQRLRRDERPHLFCSNAGQDPAERGGENATGLFCWRGRRPDCLRRTLHAISWSELRRTCQSNAKGRIGRGNSRMGF